MTEQSTIPKPGLFCSFCGKPNTEVEMLIAGPTTFICEGCVFLCFDIVAEEGKVVVRPDQLSMSHQYKMLMLSKDIAKQAKHMLENNPPQEGALELRALIARFMKLSSAVLVGIDARQKPPKEPEAS